MMKQFHISNYTLTEQQPLLLAWHHRRVIASVYDASYQATGTNLELTPVFCIISMKHWKNTEFFFFQWQFVCGSHINSIKAVDPPWR